MALPPVYGIASALMWESHAAEYRHRAAECRRCAELTSDDPRVRQEWIELALGYDALVEWALRLQIEQG
jgi:hypothetical protein